MRRRVKTKRAVKTTRAFQTRTVNRRCVKTRRRIVGWRCNCPCRWREDAYRTKSERRATQLEHRETKPENRTKPEPRATQPERMTKPERRWAAPGRRGM